eukprot:g17059.t1
MKAEERTLVACSELLVKEEPKGWRALEGQTAIEALHRTDEWRKQYQLVQEDGLALQNAPQSLRRLARLAGLSLDELWAFFDRVDLLGWCPGKKDRKSYHQWSAGYRKHRCDGHRFPLSVARLVAARLRRFGRLERYAVVVLCGRLVAAAFALSLDRCVPWTEEQDGVRFLVLPHPSGVSHFWNDEESWHRAAMVFRSALQDNLHESTVQTQHHEAELDEENLESLETKTQVPKAKGQVHLAEGLALQYAPDFKDDWEVVMCAVSKNGTALMWASDVLQADKEVVLRAVQENGGALAYASQARYYDRDVVLAAVQQRGISLRYAAQELKGDPEVVKAAARQSKRALMYAAEFLKKDAAFIREASSQVAVAVQESVISEPVPPCYGPGL